MNKSANGRVEITKELLEKAKADGKTLQVLEAETGWSDSTLQLWSSKYEISFKKSLIDLSGQTFGKLEVIGKDESKINVQRSHWFCKCACGSEKIKSYDSNSLMKGLTRSCGCHIRNLFYSGIEDFSGSHYSCIIDCARRTNRVVEVSKEFLWNLYLRQNKKCALSGVDIGFSRVHKDKLAKTCSLDRIDSNLPYLENNVQWIHKDLNRMKWDFTEEKFLRWCKLVCENHENTKLPIDDYNFLAPNPKYIKYKEVSNRFWRVTAKSAADRKIHFALDVKDLWCLFLKQGGRCNISDEPIHFSHSHKTYGQQTVSIDRIDSRGFYEISNIQLVHKNINVMKYTLPQDKFIEWCTVITEYQRTKQEQE